MTVYYEFVYAYCFITYMVLRQKRRNLHKLQGTAPDGYYYTEYHERDFFLTFRVKKQRNFCFSSYTEVEIQ